MTASVIMFVIVICAAVIYSPRSDGAQKVTNRPKVDCSIAYIKKEEEPEVKKV